MYKLTLGSENEVKYSNTAQHGLFSGTIETNRVILAVDEDGDYFPVMADNTVLGEEDSQYWEPLKDIPTYDANDVAQYEAKIDFLEKKYPDNSFATVPVFIYADIIRAKSAFDNNVDKFVEYLVDEGIIEIQNYDNPKYELSSVSVDTAGAGYTDETVVVTVPGETGDTAGEVTVTIADGACASAEITTAGSYEKKVASQVIDVPGGTTTGKIEVVMAEITE